MLKTIGPAAVSAAVFVGCAAEPPTAALPHTAPEALAAYEPAHATKDGAAAPDLATLKRVTAPYHSFERAQADGYTAKLTECMSGPEGGMGFHYANPALIDGAVRVDAPEVLLYEPRANGTLRLVGVEYIVPFGAWTAPRPPVLFGQHFHRNEGFEVWALHVWAWRHNPSGLFADWNPGVTCPGGR